jgi:hypothetical protein
MTPFRVTLVLLLLVVCVLLAAGCIGQTAGEKQTNNAPVPATSIMRDLTTTLITPVPIICPTPEPGSYWIRINPMSNVSIGDPILVNGMTNIPSGMILNITISQYQFRALPHYEPSSVSGTVEIKKTGICTNSFSYHSNSTEYLGVHEIEVEVYSLDKSLNGNNYPANLSKFYISAR